MAAKPHRRAHAVVLAKSRSGLSQSGPSDSNPSKGHKPTLTTITSSLHRSTVDRPMALSLPLAASTGRRPSRLPSQRPQLFSQRLRSFSLLLRSSDIPNCSGARGMSRTVSRVRSRVKRPLRLLSRWRPGQRRPWPLVL
jgi:hypothetical protein